MIYEIELDGFVSYCITTSGGGEVGTTYKDDKGYLLSGAFSPKFKTYIINAENYEVCYMNDKIIVSIGSLTMEEYDIPKNVTDSLGNEFVYAYGKPNDAYFYAYMAVLDEIPDDYAIIIDGVSYQLKDYISVGTIANIIFAVFFTFWGAIIIVIIIRKIRSKKRQKLMKSIF